MVNIVAYIDNITFRGTNYDLIENETFHHICDITFNGTALTTQSLTKTLDSGETVTTWKTLFMKFTGTYTSTNKSSSVGSYIYFQNTSGGTTTNTSVARANILVPSTQVASGTYNSVFYYEFNKKDDGKVLVDGWFTNHVSSQGYIYEPTKRIGEFSYSNGGCRGLYIYNSDSYIANGTLSVYGIPT